MATTKVEVVLANPIKERQVAFTRKPTVKGILLSSLVTSQPEKGSPINELMGIVRRMEPNSASLSPKAALMVGIREAQLEKLIPDRKKNTLRENRCLFNKSILVK